MAIYFPFPSGASNLLMLDENRAQVSGHLQCSLFSGRRERVVFPRMSGIRFDPLASHEPQRLQPAEQRIDRSLGDDQIGVALQPPQNFKPIEFLAPTGQPGSLAQDIPCGVALPICLRSLVPDLDSLHPIYLAMQGIMLSREKSVGFG